MHIALGIWKLYMFEVDGRNFRFIKLLYNTIDFILDKHCLDAYKYAAKSRRSIHQYLLMKTNGNRRSIQDKSNGIPLLEL